MDYSRPGDCFSFALSLSAVLVGLAAGSLVTLAAVIDALISGVHQFYDFAASRLLCSPSCLISWPLLLGSIPLVLALVSAACDSERYGQHPGNRTGAP